MYSNPETERNKSDIFRFYDDGLILNKIAKENPKVYLQLMCGPIDKDPRFLEYLSATSSLDQQNQSSFLGSNDFIIKTHSVLSFIPYSGYHSNAIIFNFLSLIGLVLLFNFFSDKYPKKKYLIFCSLILLPSLLLWTSGPLKESLALFALGLIISSLSKITSKRNLIKKILFLAIGFFVLAQVKLFIALIILPMLLVWGVNEFTKQKRIGLNYTILLFILFSLFWEIGNIWTSFGPREMVVLKNQEFIELAIKENAGSVLNNPKLENDLASFIQALPHSIVNTSLRPLPWNIKDLNYLLMLLENIFILFVTLRILFKSQFKIEDRNMFYFLLFSGALIILSYGMIVPILGALARYRSLGLLLIILALINMKVDDKKIFKYLKITQNE
jgi:hypothetical protein